MIDAEDGLESKYGSMLRSASFEKFAADLHGQGFETVVERTWAPSAVMDSHIHDFAAKALIVRGEMWLTVHDVTQHLTVGETFELASGVPHSERYGREGATYWVGRRGAP